MADHARVGQSQNYFAARFGLVLRSLTRLVRAPSDPLHFEAARILGRRIFWLAAIGAPAIVALMYVVDATEISLMPPRGSAGLWPLRILTDFGKASYVLWTLAAMLFAVLLVFPALDAGLRSRLLRWATYLEFLFLAVLTPVLAGEIVKWIVGRGRPFVGGGADVFTFSHFAGSEAYASFPSAHAITSFALAFAVSAIWPQARLAMSGYAVLIAVSRLVLLAHHPSDVVAGALIGVAGAMLVRYWFAARGLGFAIRSDGATVALAGSRPGRLKGVAREASAP
jgi:undecaprenyl-diphosphatase